MVRDCTLPRLTSIVSTGMTEFVTLKMRILPKFVSAGGVSNVIRNSVSTHRPVALLAGARLVADIDEVPANAPVAVAPNTTALIIAWRCLRILPANLSHASRLRRQSYPIETRRRVRRPADVDIVGGHISATGQNDETANVDEVGCVIAARCSLYGVGASTRGCPGDHEVVTLPLC